MQRENGKMAVCRPRWVVVSIAVIWSCLPTAPLSAINVVVDYTYDSSNFFGAGNPDGAAAGAQARSALEFAAGFYSDLLTDTFAAIETPAPFSSSMYPTTVTWTWSHSFANPSTGATTTLTDDNFAPDEYRVYAGARNLPGSTLGIGGTGGFQAALDVTGSGQVTATESNQIEQISETFFDAVENRGEPRGFSRWGGSIAFDSNNSDWHYSHLSEPMGNVDDFLTIAVHELAHALGLGTSDNWFGWVAGDKYAGPRAVAEYGGLIPLDCDDGCGHWASGVQSVELGTNTTQEAVLGPDILPGTRKKLTDLDAAALEDIGWEVEVPVVFAAADFDTDGDVDAADRGILETWYGPYTNGDADGDGDTDGTDILVWQRQYTGTIAPLVANVPEATSLGLLATGFVAAGFVRRRR